MLFIYITILNNYELLNKSKREKWGLEVVMGRGMCSLFRGWGEVEIEESKGQRERKKQSR